MAKTMGVPGLGGHLTTALRARLDKHFPERGSCLCGSEETETTLGARHRLIDAVAENVLAGDGEAFVAKAYGLPLEAVHVACEWVEAERANKRPRSKRLKKG